MKTNTTFKTNKVIIPLYLVLMRPLEKPTSHCRHQNSDLDQVEGTEKTMPEISGLDSAT